MLKRNKQPDQNKVIKMVIYIDLEFAHRLWKVNFPSTIYDLMHHIKYHNGISYSGSNGLIKKFFRTIAHIQFVGLSCNIMEKILW